jgi:4-aminobutyrate aminotransferase-like enzyme/Ser/Thr protein kinase RdoA (MazF antagonist)
MDHSTDVISPFDGLMHRVAQHLTKVYGITGALKPLPSERDHNFLIEHDGKPHWVAKLISSGEPGEATAFQTDLLLHLEQYAADFPAPRVIRTLQGKPWADVELAAGETRKLRVVGYLNGLVLAKAKRAAQTLHSLGSRLAALDKALFGFAHPGQFQDLDWDIRATPRCRSRLHCIADGADRAVVTHFLDRFDAGARPMLPRLRHGVIHNDANDWNVIVDAQDGSVSGLIDFGDAMHGPLIAELAVACAYAMLDQPDPLGTAAEVIAGYNTVLRLEDEELDCLFDLIAARLCISVTKSAERKAEAQANGYLLVSEKAAWALLHRLRLISPAIATGIFRKAADRPASQRYASCHAWLDAHAKTLAPVTRISPARMKKHVLKLDGSDATLSEQVRDQDWTRADQTRSRYKAMHPFELGIGLWHERRNVYHGEMFRSKLIEDRMRDLHLGIDLFLEAGTALYAPLDGVVVSCGYGSGTLDYGGVLLLQHDPAPGVQFWTLWGHLDPQSIARWKPGARIKRGEAIAALGNRASNGGWEPHLHIQLSTIAYEQAADMPGVGEVEFAPIWAELFPDPTQFIGLPAETFARNGASRQELMARRKSVLGANLSVSYGAAPLKIMRGDDVWLIDDEGRAYLDCFNNVAHVGHEHPRVVEALRRQAGILNTNTRYLHDNVINYAERLRATLPPSLSVCYFVNSGSEANDLALRMVRAHTRRKDMVVIDWAYHGHGGELIEISPYKYKRKGGEGRPAHVHELPLPDVYRAVLVPGETNMATHFAKPAQELCERLVAAGTPPAAFIAETVPSVAGQIFLPDGYLQSVYGSVRAAGGLCIADEVQVGFGRTGTMWAFEAHGVVPDIVTMGKPIGNGHPLAALVTTPEVAASFNNGMEYFNTFGGNPVSCAVGLEVLSVLQDDKLIAHANTVGAYILDGLKQLQTRHDCIGDVRGSGLFFGLDLVTDRSTKAHATELARQMTSLAFERGVLIGTDGPFDNVIKMRPPMTFQQSHADILLECLDDCFSKRT